MKKLILFTTVAVGFLFGLLLWSSPKTVEAGTPFKEICHHNPSKSVTLTFMNENAYNGHLGTPHNPGVFDTDGACDTQESDMPSMDEIVSCGQVQLEFFNPTRFFFSFDYRKDGEAGTDDGVTGMNIANGPFAGEPFGQRYNIVDVDGRADVHYGSAVVSFPEDSGTHLVEYRLWRGAENDWYLPWESVEVETNCLPDEEKEKDEDVCANIEGIQTSVPEGKHLDASGLNCVEFELGGAPVSEGTSSSPQVLGTSTMAGTGVAEENLFNLIFALGSLLSAFGIRKFSTSRVK